MGLSRTNNQDKLRIRAIAKAFAETEMIMNHKVDYEEANGELALKYIRLADQLSAKIKSGDNTLYMLTSEDGNIVITVIMGTPTKTVNLIITKIGDVISRK